MAPPVLQALRRLPAFAAAALSTLCVASARADIVPHVQLTPYNIVTSQNKCVQVRSSMIGALDLVTCNPNDNLQKFYVLDNASDTDVVFQTLPAAGARVRIALASTFDTVPTTRGQYNLLAIDGSIVVLDTASVPGGSPPARTWIMTRNPVGASPTINRLWAANESTSFRVVGERTVSYGANGRFIEKVVNAFNMPDNAVPCSNAFFGGDPIVNVYKACYINSLAGAQTKFQVRLAVYGRSYDCVATYSTSLATQPCTQPNQSELTFTFRPTSYPQ